MSNSSALLVVDVVNEIVHPDGKFAPSGWGEQVAARGVLGTVARVIAEARAAGIPVVYTTLAFSADYRELPAASPLLGAAKDYGALSSEWATAVHDDVAPQDGDLVVTKRRISPFYGTELDLQLRSQGVRELYVVGVSTDLAVLSAARDAHDRDYRVTVIEDGCAAASAEAHDAALGLLRTTAVVADSGSFATAAAV